MQDWSLLIHETRQTHKTQDRLNVKYLSLMSDFPHFMIRFLYICTLIGYICTLCGTEHGSSSDETGTNPSIHASKSWESVCESNGESHRKQRAARPAISNDNIATLVLVGTDMYL
jgi:hypothetical protein